MLDNLSASYGSTSLDLVSAKAMSFSRSAGDNPSFEESVRTALVARSNAVYVRDVGGPAFEGLDYVVEGVDVVGRGDKEVEE